MYNASEQFNSERIYNKNSLYSRKSNLQIDLWVCAVEANVYLILDLFTCAHAAFYLCCSCNHKFNGKVDQPQLIKKVLFDFNLLLKVNIKVILLRKNINKI